MNILYSVVHWRKLTNENEGKPKQEFDAAFETIFRISKFFQRSKQKLCIYFPTERGRLIVKKNSCACTESTQLILMTLKQIFFCWPNTCKVLQVVTAPRNSSACGFNPLILTRHNE